MAEVGDQVRPLSAHDASKIPADVTGIGARDGVPRVSRGRHAAVADHARHAAVSDALELSVPSGGGIQTSKLTAGLVTPVTRQNAGRPVIGADPGGVNERPVTRSADTMVVSESRSADSFAQASFAANVLTATPAEQISVAARAARASRRVHVPLRVSAV